VAGEDPAPGPSPGARCRCSGAYVVNGGYATVAKERGTVHLVLGSNDDGVVSHHCSCGLSYAGSSRRRRREGGSSKREDHCRRHGSSLVNVDPSGGGIDVGETHAELVEDLSSCCPLCKVDA
jgi:hypothetical protein